MKTQLRSVTSLVILLFISMCAQAQDVFPGKRTIDKIEYLGLTLNQNIAEKYQSKYWETYLSKFGKVKGRRALTIEKASIPGLSGSPAQLISEVSSQKDDSQVFMALNVGGKFISDSDETYKSAESFLKAFSEYAAGQEELRIADEAFVKAEKGYQKLLKDNESTAKDVDKTDKKLTELRLALEKGKSNADSLLIDLQTKQKTLESLKGRIPSKK